MAVFPRHPPVFYFRDGGVEVTDLEAFFDGGIGNFELTDVENGEYELVFDAVGGRIRILGRSETGQRSTLRRMLRLGPPRRENLWTTYEPPSDTSRALLAEHLRRVLGDRAAGGDLAEHVARAIDELGSPRTQERLRGQPRTPFEV